MSRRPCLVVCLLYIIGILINIPYPYPFLFLLNICFFILFFLKNKASIIALYLSIVLFGSLSCKLHSYKGPLHIAHRISQKGDIIGTIIDYPRRYKDITSATLNVESFNGRKTKGLVSVSTKESSVFFGNRLFIHNVLIKEPKVYNNPARFNKKKNLLRKKIYVTIFSDRIKILQNGKINVILKIASKIKLKAEKIISLLPPLEKNLLLGILLRERANLSDKIYKAFQDTGTIHILSVSGLHLALLFGFFVILFGMLGMKKPYKFILTIPILFLFCLITGSSIPTVRSLIIILIFILSLCFEREPDIYNSLSLAALIILILNPFQIYDIGFQLSFIACLSLSILTPRLIFRKDKLSLFFSSCLAAAIGIAPIVLFWFSKVSFISPISNLFIIPIISILLPLGLIFILIGFINISLASLLILPISLLTKVTMFLIFFFSSIPGSSITLPSPSIPIVIFLYLLIVIFAFQIKRLFIPALIILNILLFYNVIKPRTYEVTFLDVGLGDCIFIKSPCGYNILIDGGPIGTGRSCVLPFLKYKGIDRIDILIATHQDADHIGGFVDIIPELNIKRVFYNGLSSPSLTYKRFKEAIAEKDIHLEVLKIGNRIKGADFDIEVLNPLSHLFSDSNNNSIVLKLNFKDLSFLLPGDIEDDAIGFIARMYKEKLDAIILKAPHHGRRKMPEHFVAFVNPELIIASGWDAFSKKTISTKRYGAITIKGDKMYKVKTYLKLDGRW